MQHTERRRWIITISLVMAATLGIVISLLVLGGPERDFTATAYSDVIRFEAEGVATLQVRIFDLSGKEVWGSGVVSGWSTDWDRRNDFGEQLAYGAYIYSAQGWSAQGDLIFQKNGKLALMPDDTVQLQAAPVVSLPQTNDGLAPFRDDPFAFQPMAVDVDHSTESWAFGQVGIGTTSPISKLQIIGATGDEASVRLETASGNSPTISVWSGSTYSQYYYNAPDGAMYVQLVGDPDGKVVLRNYDSGAALTMLSNGNVGIGTTSPISKLQIIGATGDEASVRLETASGNSPTISVWSGSTYSQYYYNAPDGAMYVQLVGDPDGKVVLRNYDSGAALTMLSNGNVGIGTTSPTAALEVYSSATNLLALYDPAAPTDPKFRVEKTGTVRADGAYYSGTGGFHTGSADVAERINTSEWVETGNVVEIDLEHPGFFRKSSSPYSTKVAGIISTSPGVILGNSFDEATDDWEDNRPLLAVTGRVPCKATAENGAIEIGDLLVASSTSGIAMKGNPEESMGAVVGKAIEPLREGEGVIMVQVMLR